MVNKEVVRALLERQDINGLHLLFNQTPAFQQNQPEGLTSTNHEWALHRQRLGDMVPMNALHALVMHCGFRCDHTMHGEGGHSINDCTFPPSVKSRLVWIAVSGIRVGAAQGLRGKTRFLPSKQLASRAQFRAPPTSPLLPLSPTLAQECLTQFMCSLVLGRGYTPFQCQTRRGSR